MNESADRPPPLTEDQARYYAAIEAARLLPVAAVLDELALQDLVSLQMWVPRDDSNEHAAETWRYIDWVLEAKNSMKANYWLRRAMVHAKDFMLWDDAVAQDKYRQGQRDRRRGTGVNHEQVKRFHARLSDQHDATSQTATHFELSTRQVRNIINPPIRNRK